MTISRNDAAHLLRRTGFGATPAAIDALSTAADWTAAVDRVLDTSANPPVVRPPQLSDPALGEYPRFVASCQWWIDRMRTSPTPIVEKMALFWHGHFVSGTDKVPNALMWDQVDLYRRQGLGDYHALAQAMAKSPAMLLYLDNATNAAPGRINENFGRELMELFLMGNGTFAESDVLAMSRAWTGHGINAAETAYEWHAGAHDNTNKTLFGITRNWDGPAAITEILHGSKQAVAARFITAKLWAFFAGPGADPAPIGPLTAAFVAAGLDVEALLRALLLRPEFRAAATRTALVRSPIEWLVANLQALAIPAADAHPEWFLEGMGQEPYRPPNVAGWKANQAWLSTSALWARADFVGHLRWIATDDNRPYKRFVGLADRPMAEIVATAFSTYGITDPSPATSAVLERWITAVKPYSDRRWSIRPNTMVITALSPDFQLA